MAKQIMAAAKKAALAWRGVSGGGCAAWRRRHTHSASYSASTLLALPRRAFAACALTLLNCAARLTSRCCARPASRLTRRSRAARYRCYA